MSIAIYTYGYICVCVCIYVYTHANTHTRTHTHICIFKCTQDFLIVAFVQPSMPMFFRANTVQRISGIPDALAIISQHPLHLSLISNSIQE